MSSRVLVIGDLHQPFTKVGYLQFCVDVYRRYKCDKVVFAGDIIDHHATSYHENESDAMSSVDEFEAAKKELSLWYHVFPNALVCSGNHDVLPIRKAKTGGIARQMIRPLNEAYELFNWNFSQSHEIDGVHYCHGTSMQAKKKAMMVGMPVVQGHYHSKSYIDYINQDLWACQIGCGVDSDSYAMRYGKDWIPFINVAVVTEDGPTIVFMKD